MTGADIGFIIGTLIGLLLLLGLLVGGVLLVVSARRSARRAREHAADPQRQGPVPGSGTGKLVGGVLMLVVGGLGVLGQLASAGMRASGG